MRRFIILLASLTLLLGPGGFLVGGERVDYLREIKPILSVRCYSCHGVLKQKAGLRLETRELWLKGGESGAVIVAGDPGRSRLVERISAGEADRMPPAEEGTRLSESEQALIRVWIEQGAEAPEEPIPEAPGRHWAFQKPVRGTLPEVGTRWDGNPIDAFLAAGHEVRGLVPVAPAERRVLLRRVYLDLIGLPPGREVLRAFEADEAPDAYERVVRDLLSRPAHGERWGRHWMDVWRYADWFGLGDQLRNSQKHLWHWRDWIVESLNADKGYDRMIVEMLAADEVAADDPGALRATGFLARHYYLFNRDTWMEDTVEHTSKAFLGLTVNCAKCHDHKYDPISQVDYYSMRAFFEPYQVRLDAVPGETDLEKDGVPRVFDAHLDEPTYLFVRGDSKNPDKSRVIGPGLPSVFGVGDLGVVPVKLAPEARQPGLRAHVLQDRLREAERRIEEAEQALGKAKSQVVLGEASEGGGREVELAERLLEAARLRPAALRAAHEADRARAHGDEGAGERVKAAARAARELELAEAEAAVLRAEQQAELKRDEAKEGRELKAAREALEKARAGVGQPGENYAPLRASWKALEGPDEKEDSRRKPYPEISSGRRTALARWIASRDNPLTARVIVNQIWMRHFGQPLVETVTDFGLRAAEPRQKALLDWLAVEFMESGWSMKRLHQLMVTSRAYRLGSSTLGADPATLKADPENHYYWRRGAVRMEAEVIRDSLLALAGVLDETMGGAPVPVSDGVSHRRSLYFVHSRDGQDKFLSMFDAADIFRCYRRGESVVPQQALALANSKLGLTLSRQVAERLDRELGVVGDEFFIRAAFEAVLGVLPTGEEVRDCQGLLDETRTLLRGGDEKDVDGRARANLVHALVNHNDFVTVR